ncbi:hypothetical protein Tco_1212949 [Tanacetum coccineum]
MSGTIPPIPPPFGATSGNPDSPNVNRVDTMPATTDPINTTTTTNVAQCVVDENIPQLLDSRGGSHVTNVPAFDKEDFTNGPFVPMSSLSTTENSLPKCQNQWSNAESRLANQDKRLKSIIISCLPNDVMKFVIKWKTTKEMWNDLILAHEGPSDTRYTKIAALRLKFNAFKSLEGEKVMGTFTRLKCLLNDLENNGVTILQVEVNATFVNSLPTKWLSMNQTQRANNSIKNDSLATIYGKYNYEEGLIDQIYDDSDVEEDQRTNNEFMADLNAEYHERALLENQKRFYKRSGRGKSEKGKIDKGKSEKGLIAESFDWDEEYVSSEDEGTTRIRAFMAIAKDEPSVGKADARYMTGVKQYLHIYSKETGPKVVFGDDDQGHQKDLAQKKCENLHEVRLTDPRSDTDQRLENKSKRKSDEKGYRQEYSHLQGTPEQNSGEAVNTACYTQNRSIIVKRHGKTAYDVFRRRSLDINYFSSFSL